MKSPRRSRKVEKMLVTVTGKNLKGYEEGLELIEKARKYTKEKKLVDVRVLESLDSIEEFWVTENMYSSFMQPVNILSKALHYFSTRRKNIKFSDWNKICQGLLEELKQFLISEEDMKVLDKFQKKLYSVTELIMLEKITIEEFEARIECEITKFQLESKFEGSDREKEVAMYKFVKETVSAYGVSETYMAQIFYRKLIKDLYDATGSDKEDMEKLALDLETYRCIVKKSTASKEELLQKYSPCVWSIYEK